MLQSEGPALHQLDFDVEALSHPVGVAMPNVAHHRFKPPAQRSGDALQRFQRTLTGAFNEFQKCFASRFFILALKSLSQVLHPVNHFA